MTTKTYASLLLTLILTAITAPSAEARRAPEKNNMYYYSGIMNDRHAVNGSIAVPPEWHFREPAKQVKRTAKQQRKPVRKKFKIVAPHKIEPQIVEHPEGCPRTSFCGCGVSMHVYGYSVRELWLARNWMKFPEALPGPGKVAVRHGHVFAILKDFGDGMVLAYDPNSGKHKTRIWVRNLAGYRIVDPGQRWVYAG